MSSLPSDEPPPGVKPAGCPSGGKQEEPGPFELEGECVQIGNSPDGQARLVIYTTQEEIRAFQGSLLYQTVTIRLKS